MLARTSLLTLLVCCVVGRIGRKGYKHNNVYHPYQHFHHHFHHGHHGYHGHHGFYLRRSLPSVDRVRKANIVQNQEDLNKTTVNETTHQASKRGFLANLATLLNDADTLAKKIPDDADTLAKKSPDSSDKNETATPVAPLNPAPLSSAPLSPAPLSPAPLSPAPLISAPKDPTPLIPAPLSPAPLISAPINPPPLIPAPALSAITPNTAKPKVSKEEINGRSRLKSLSDPTPSALAVENTLLYEGKSSAPVFALFHGKIVPLGRLPDSSFRKSHTDIKPIPSEKIARATDSATQKIPNKNEIYTRENETTDIPRSIARSIANKKTFENTKPIGNPEQIEETAKTRIETSESGSLITTKDSNGLSPHKYSRLLSYLSNLSDPTASVRTDKPITKNVRGITKDQVTFPDTHTLKHPDLLTHIKGLVLDSGKIVSLWAHQFDGLGVNGNSVEDQPEEGGVRKDSETVTGEEDKMAHGDQKMESGDEAELTNLIKSKERIEEASARDTTERPLSLSVDSLKDLLKKTDNKASLAELLNNRATASATNAREAKPEEDPGTIEDFAAGGLKAHNEDRGLHHSPPLIWSDDLAADAQKLAEEIADGKTLKISKDLEKKGYGENVAKVWATFKTAGEAAVKMWFSQSTNYHFDDPHLDENTGQFAQVVWKDTKELGMGVAKSIDDINNKYVYVTALYRPPGNIESSLRDNVLPTGNNTVDVYSTFFKRSGAENERLKTVLSPRHAADKV